MNVYNKVTREEADWIMTHLRDKSRYELDALGLDRRVAASLIVNAPIASVIYGESGPAAVFGASEQRPGVWSCFGFGTDEWKSVWRLVTLEARKCIVHNKKVRGAHRVQSISPAEHADTHKWLRFMGLDCEVDMPRYGANGEDFKLLYWFKEAV